MLNDDAIKELDRDVASQFLENIGIIIDLKPAIVQPEIKQETKPAAQKKTVTFKMNSTEQEDYNNSIN